MSIIIISKIILYAIMFNLSRSLRINPYSTNKFRYYRLFSTISNTPTLPTTTTPTPLQSILSMPYNDFAEFIGGKGKAKMVWEQFRLYGMDPLHEDSKLSAKVKQHLSELLKVRYMYILCCHFLSILYGEI